MVHVFLSFVDQTRIKPQFVAVKLGDSALFMCNMAACMVEDAHPLLWTFNDGLLPFNADLSCVASHSVLTISDIQTNNQGTYECNGFTERMEKFIAQAQLLIRGIITIFLNAVNTA